VQLIKDSFYLVQFSLLSVLTTINSVGAESINNQSNFLSTTQIKETQSQISTSAQDLLAQQNPVTRVTGIEVKQTDKGLEIILKTAKQPLDQDFTEAELQVGNREFVRSRFDINIPARDDEKVSARINGVYQHEASFRNFDNDINQISLAPVFKWKIGDRTDLTFNLEYIHKESFADFGLTQFGDGVAPVSREFVTNNPDDTIDTDYVSTGYSFEHRFNDDWKIRNGFRFISYNSDYSVIALPFIVEGANITRFFADQDGEDRSYSLFTNTVGNFKTGSIKHILTAGIDLNRSESNIFTLFGGPSVLNIFNPIWRLS
jgi:iron complex outermembrane receptor protein